MDRAGAGLTDRASGQDRARARARVRRIGVIKGARGGLGLGLRDRARVRLGCKLP